MCSLSALAFGRRVLTQDVVRGRKVLEVGSRMVQSPELTLRHHVRALEPASYLGVDLFPGDGVDCVMSVHDLAKEFGSDAFDVVASTELVEHVADWRGAFANMKAVLKPGGLLVVTTRSPGFAYHGWPHDHWRYTCQDIREILVDMDCIKVESDPDAPGVFLAAQKPIDFEQADLAQLRLHHIVGRRRRLAPPSRITQLAYVGALHVFRRARGLRG
jgi:SAM-dependent methyltransferase